MLKWPYLWNEISNITPKTGYYYNVGRMLALYQEHINGNSVRKLRFFLRISDRSTENKIYELMCILSILIQ